MTLEDNMKYLKELTELKQNWFSPDEGTPISKEVITKTEKILKSLGKYQPYVYPTVDGCIQLEWEGIGIHDCIKIVVREDRIEYMQMLNKETIDVNNLSIELIPGYVKLFYKEESNV